MSSMRYVTVGDAMFGDAMMFKDAMFFGKDVVLSYFTLNFDHDRSSHVAQL